MPNYGTITYGAGFYHNKNSNGIDDRVYTAEDLRKPYNSVYSKGVKPEADGTAGAGLKVTAVGGMSISVAKGEANLGAWFENRGAFRITLDNSIGTDRYDAVIIRNDDNDDVRMPSIYIKSLSRVPTVSDLTRNEKVYEICVAYVRVPALADQITAGNIVDTREDGQLCNVMSGVGATVVRTYRNTVYSSRASQTGITIGIPQFDRTRDHLTVIIEGRILSSASYTIPSNTYVELSLGLPVIGTRVDFEVRKNVNAAGADTVVQEVGGLLNDMASVNKTLENHYYCNGKTDNVDLSRLVTNLQANYTDYSSIRIVLHGYFGATNAAGGSGTADNPYYWVRSAQGAASSRRIILDFTDCREITINFADGTHNIVFFGMDTHIIGANVRVSGGATAYMFSAAGGASIYAENCRFWVTTTSNGLIARSGTFKNCRASVTNTGLHSYCFAPITGSLLRIEGGEYYAYTASTEHVSAIVGLTSGENAVAIMYAVNAPTSERSGYRQTNSVYQTTGIVSCTDLISTLPLNVVSGASNIRGTIAKSKAGLM